jgi:hypothetical protein
MDRQAADADRYSTRVELLAIPVVAVIFGIGALVMFAAHMWDEAPANETSSGLEDT